MLGFTLYAYVLLSLILKAAKDCDTLVTLIIAVYFCESGSNENVSALFGSIVNNYCIRYY